MFRRMYMRHTCFKKKRQPGALGLDEFCGHMGVLQIRMVSWLFGPFGRWPYSG